MQKAQYGILRFAKYKGPEIGNIEAHNERTKEKYASNPDVDTSRSKYNIHLVEPQGKYPAAAEKQIAAAGCKTWAVHLNRQRDIILQTLKDITPFNAGRKSAEVAEMIKKYISGAEDMRSALKGFECEIRALQAENAKLKKRPRRQQREYSETAENQSDTERVWGLKAHRRNYSCGDFGGLFDT